MNRCERGHLHTHRAIIYFFKFYYRQCRRWSTSRFYVLESQNFAKSVLGRVDLTDLLVPNQESYSP
jgi:hypothetical protein